MTNNFKYVAIIPARAGSKRLKNKNIIDFNGKPLIYWTIQSALNSSYISRVIVSTDSIEIQRIANDLDVPVLNLRPQSLSLDETKTEEVLLYEIQNLTMFENFILLQPTSPLRNTQDIDLACQLFERKNCRSLVSIAEIKHRLECLYRKTEDHIEKLVIQNSGPAQKIYALNGAIYIRNLREFQRTEELVDANTVGYEMSNFKSVDIDTIEDLKLAELLSKLEQK